MGRVTDFLERKLVSLIGAERFLPLQIDITNSCNLRCAHCYHPHHRNDGALSLNQWFGVLDQYNRLIEKIQFDPYVLICGGEPMVSPLLAPILDRLSREERPVHVSILTNGTLARRFNFQNLNGLSSVTFQVSLDGADAASHDAVRGPGSFERALDGIKVIQGSGFSVSLLTVLSRRTSAQIPSFFDLAASIGVESLGFARLIVNGYAVDLVHNEVDRPLDSIELKEAYMRIICESGRTGVRSSLQKPLFHLLHPQLGRSGRFAEGLVVDYQGNILASSRSRLVLGDAFKDGLENVFFNHPIFKAIRAGHVETCGQCKSYRRCGGDRNAAYAASGNYLGADPGCWLQFEHQLKQTKGNLL